MIVTKRKKKKQQHCFSRVHIVLPYVITDVLIKAHFPLKKKP